MIYLGNEAIHLLTKKSSQELRVDIEKFTGEKAYAKYSTFSVGTESQKYKLTIGAYNGNAGKMHDFDKVDVKLKIDKLSLQTLCFCRG